MQQNRINYVKSEVIDIEIENQEKVEYKADTQARNWCFTVNNPTVTDIEFYEYLQTLAGVKYFIFCRERGNGTKENPDGTVHFQGYIEFGCGKRFSTLVKDFGADKVGNQGHIEPRHGTRKGCVDYVRKVGKHKDKAETQIGDVIEWGEFIADGQRSDLEEVVAMVGRGASDSEIKEAFPSQFLRYYRNIEDLRGAELRQKFLRFSRMYREGMRVVYIYGSPRTGKTRYVYDKYGYDNVYSVAGYKEGKCFDDYEGQDVLLLDEYRSSFNFGMLLKYTDGQPCSLLCRFRNRVACWTKVYIISNIPLTQQHKDIQRDEPESWKALLARITDVYDFNTSKEIPINRKKSLTELTPVDGEDLLF